MTISVARVISAVGVPAFVKNAQVTDDGEYDSKTRESTYISWVRAIVKQASAEELKQCLVHAKFWNIEKDCLDAQAKYAALIAPPTIKDSDYALSFAFGDKQIRKFASFDAHTTVQAAISFYEQRGDFAYAQRCSAAENLLCKAASLDVTLPAYIDTYLQKAAGFGALGVHELEDAIIKREQECPVEFREDFNKVATVINELLESESLRTDYDFVKSAMTVIDGFDQESGYTGPLIEEAIPGDLLVSELKKVAAESAYHVKLVNGREVDVRGLEKAALAAVSPELSYASIDKLAAILPTLPRDDADLLTTLIS